jgi:hypothetical protein
VITLAVSARALCEALELRTSSRPAAAPGCTARAARQTAGPQCGDQLRPGARRGAGPAAPRHRHHRAGGPGPPLEGLCRLLAERPGQAARGPVPARPLPGVPVSMPLRWEEVGPGLHPRKFTALDAAARMERLGSDPFLGVLGEAPNLVGVLSRLQAYLERRGNLRAPVGGPTRTGRWGGGRKSPPHHGDAGGTAQGRHPSGLSSSGGRPASPAGAARPPAPRGRRRRPPR